MSKQMRLIRLAAILALASTAGAAESEWTRFRGPNGSGISDAAKVPAKWTERAYNWKVTLPGVGSSSPVVWGERIFVTCGEPETAKRLILCLRSADGHVQWQREYPSRTYAQHRDNCYAAATPAVDAEGVVVTWTTPEQVVLLALDLDGGEVWRRDFGAFVVESGCSGISPILYEDLVVLANDQDENHTYDDYFGDLSRGDSDPALCFWGRAHTPNQHALADRFALCDNFYAEAEMTVEGHLRVEGANFTDVLERFWRLARPRCDVIDPTYWPVRGSIFDECERRKVGYRIYGGALLSEHLKDAVLVRNWVKDESGKYKPSCPTDVALAQRFADDLAQGISARFTYLTLGRDHSEEGGPAVDNPLVHDNDEATGIVVEAVSRSPHWAETAIFIVQDDPAGNFIDHVSTHRIPCLVVGLHVKREHIDQHHYSFPSILRTIEMILGLEPLSRYDWGATPMTDCFEERPDNKEPFTTIKAGGR